MDLFLIWFIVFFWSSFFLMVTSTIDNWFSIGLRFLPIVLCLSFIYFVDDYFKSYYSIHKEIYEKGNLTEFTKEIKESKSYQKYVFEKQWEEKEGNSQ